MPVVQSISSMTKAEAVQALKDLGEIVYPSWTSVEIKSKLVELKKREDLTHNQKLKGLHGMKKNELEDLARACGIPFTDNDTKGSLMRKLRDQNFLQSTPDPNDLMSFGKYAHMTYDEVTTLDPSYIRWAKEAAMDGQCSPYLRRFAIYCNNVAVQSAVPMSPRASVTIPGPTPEPAVPTRKRRTATAHSQEPVNPTPTTAYPSASSTSPPAVQVPYPTPPQQDNSAMLMQQVMGAINALNTRLNTLENQVPPQPTQATSVTDSSDITTEHSFQMEDGSPDPAGMVFKDRSRD